MPDDQNGEIDEAKEKASVAAWEKAEHDKIFVHWIATVSPTTCERGIRYIDVDLVGGDSLSVSLSGSSLPTSDSPRIRYVSALDVLEHMGITGIQQGAILNRFVSLAKVHSRSCRSHHKTMLQWDRTKKLKSPPQKTTKKTSDGKNGKGKKEEGKKVQLSEKQLQIFNLCIPQSWFILFLHFVCRYQEDLGQWADWWWIHFCREPRRTSTIERFFMDCFKMAYRDAFHLCQRCLQDLNLLDAGDRDGILAVPPSLAVTTPPPPAVVIATRLKDYPIVYQDKAVDTIASLIHIRLFQTVHSKPLVILLPGPTASGKTTTVQSVVRYLFGSDVWNQPAKRDAVYLAVDVNTYVDEYSINRLLGADPGLVTSDTGKGSLIHWLENLHDDEVGDRPISGVLLLDEIEKAGKNTRLLVRLMGLFENGSIVGANTFKTLRATKLLIFCCTNAAAEILERRPASDTLDKEQQSRLNKDLIEQCCAGDKSNFGRFDKVVPYFGFSHPQRQGVISAMLDEYKKVLCSKHENRIALDIDKNSLMIRLSQVWDTEQINARAIRNFLSNFDALLLQYLGSRPLTDSDTKDIPLQLFIRGSENGLECCAGKDWESAAFYVLPQMGQLTEWHRLAVHATSPPSEADLDRLNLNDIDKVDDHGRSPLHFAASNCNVTMVEFLLEQGANPQTSDDAGYNALMHAVAGDTLTLTGDKRPRRLDNSWADTCVAIIHQLKREDPPALQQNAREANDKQRTALLILLDSMLDILQAEDADVPPAAVTPDVIVEACSRVACHLLVWRIQTRSHNEWIKHALNEGRIPLRYFADIDASGQSVIHRLLSYVHLDQRRLVVAADPDAMVDDSDDDDKNESVGEDVEDHLFHFFDGVLEVLDNDEDDDDVDGHADTERKSVDSKDDGGDGDAHGSDQPSHTETQPNPPPSPHLPPSHTDIEQDVGNAAPTSDEQDDGNFDESTLTTSLDFLIWADPTIVASELVERPCCLRSLLKLYSDR